MPSVKTGRDMTQANLERAHTDPVIQYPCVARYVKAPPLVLLIASKGPIWDKYQKEGCYLLPFIYRATRKLVNTPENDVTATGI